MSGIQAGKVAKYVLLPEIVPRARRFFTSGFGYIAFLMASIYGMVRLLPPGHPYLNPSNTGSFGLRHVITEAANHLVFSRKNIDQIIIFFALLMAVALLFMQFAFLIYAILLKPAMAASLFNTPSGTGPELTDIAFVMLDNVFGIPGIFCNNAGICTTVAGGVGAWSTPFHLALHMMFRFYSTGLLLVGVLVFLYYVVVVIAETATSGTPFGQRFQDIWVPLRLIVALLLLVPINYGMNSGQYIALYAAKFGSGFATNAWRTFNNTIIAEGAAGARSNPSGETRTLLALPTAPKVVPVVHFMSMVHSCAYAHWRVEKTPVYASLTNPNDIPLNTTFDIKPYFVKNVEAWMTGPAPNSDPFMLVTETTTMAEALAFFYNGDVVIRFGRQDSAKYKAHTGGVEPTCGEIKVKVSDLTNVAAGAGVGGSIAVQQRYFDMVKFLWFDTGGTGRDLRHLSQNRTEGELASRGVTNCPGGGAAVTTGCLKPGAAPRQTIIDNLQATLDGVVIGAWNVYRTNSTDIGLTPRILDLGWGGAGIWYNAISRINGAFIAAVRNLPAPSLYPKAMMDVMEYRRANDSKISGNAAFCPNAANSKPVELASGADGLRIAQALCNINKYWTDDTADQGADQEGVGKNAFESILHMVFGTQGLFDMRGQNASIHPLAQLAAVGKSLVDAAVLNIAVSTGFATVGGLLGLVAGQAEKVATIISQLANAIAFMGLTAGFVLFYILPFLPFVYFMFALASWTKTIFEAMVGIPLWALAHLRIDGDGLPGDAASNGYFLIFEIFIRPILTIFGLAAAVIIFSAQVRVLNFTWGIVVDNITGYQKEPLVGVIANITVPRGIVDQFFFTIIYTIIVYMLATASFKLIDKLPDNILRWMGAGVSSFGDINDDSIQSITRYAAMGGMTVGQKATQGLQQLGAQTGNALKGELQKMSQGIDKIIPK